MPYTRGSNRFNTSNVVFAPMFDMQRVNKFMTKAQDPLGFDDAAKLMLKDKQAAADQTKWGVCNAMVMRWCKYIHDHGGHLQSCRPADLQGSETVELQSLYQSRAAIRQLRGKSGGDATANVAVAQRKLAESQGMQEHSRYQSSSLDPEARARVVADEVCQLLTGNPFRVQLQFGAGAHAIGMYYSVANQTRYVLDPNFGLRAYTDVAEFKADLVDLFTATYGTSGRVSRVELFEVSP